MNIQKDIIAEIQYHEGIRREQRAAQGIVVMFVFLVIGILGGLYWKFVHDQPVELIVIAAPEHAKVIPPQAEPQQALRILNLNNPAAAAEAEQQDRTAQIIAPEPESLGLPEQSITQEDDQARLARLQQKILAGLEIPETEPEQPAANPEQLEAEILDDLKS